MVKAAALFVPDSFDKDRFIYTSQILWPQVSILRTILPVMPSGNSTKNGRSATAFSKILAGNQQHPLEGSFPIFLIALTILAKDRWLPPYCAQRVHSDWVVNGDIAVDYEEARAYVKRP